MATKINLPKNPTPEQLAKLKKPLVKAIISEFYLDGLDELTVEDGQGNVIAQGKFLDRRVDGGKTNNRVFEYEIRQEGQSYVCEYKPISGDFNEPLEWQDDEAKLVLEVRSRRTQQLEFAGGEVLSDEWFEAQERERHETLVAELQEAGLGDLIVEA